jgi:hypothetical protein
VTAKIALLGNYMASSFVAFSDGPWRHVDSRHPDVGQSLSNLADLYRGQGKYEKAEGLLKRALAALAVLKMAANKRPD